MTVVSFRLTSRRKINTRVMQNTAPSSNKAECDAIGDLEWGQGRMPQDTIRVQGDQSIIIVSAGSSESNADRRGWWEGDDDVSVPMHLRKDGEHVDGSQRP